MPRFHTDRTRDPYIFFLPRHDPRHISKELKILLFIVLQKAEKNLFITEKIGNQIYFNFSLAIMKAEESPDFPKNITSARLSRPNEHTLDSSSLVGSSSITPLLDSCTLAGCLYAWDWDSAFR